ncbi:MAG: competence/damage-inducible protein A [Rhodospirillaceae bacterium]|nr:competence/damage-inducible protein A [Rhodospirillaceae bacterium]HAA91484.1 competence/damage-inducible protein A [Rhodospirillaceae bacterium]
MASESQSDKKRVTAALLIIGDEILSGQTHDKNLPYIAESLNGAGVQLAEVRVVPDIKQEIIDAVNALRSRYDYLFTTGGIGPTHDDITAESVSEAVGRKLIQHPEARRRLEEHFKYNGTEVNEARLRMANTPEGADLIDNPISTAPGFKIENVHVMAGVPRIMQAMMDNVTATLEGGATKLTRSVLCNLGEGTIAGGLKAIQGDHPDIDIGSYPHYARGEYRLSLVLRGFDDDELQIVQDAVFDMITGLGGDPIRGEDLDAK